MAGPFDSDKPAQPGMATLVRPPRRQRDRSRRKKRPPRYHVVLWDSDAHTFDYVERMLGELFGHEPQACRELARQVDEQGRAIVLTTTLEHAELKRDQIHAYGKDDIENSTGSMWSTIEPGE